MAFKFDSDLTNHHLAHCGYKPHKCKKCEKSFLRKYELHQHQILVHSNVVSCRVKNCGVRLPKAELYEHIETAHPKLKFQCEICPMSYKHKRDLIVHQAIVELNRTLVRCVVRSFPIHLTVTNTKGFILVTVLSSVRSVEKPLLNQAT